MKTAELIGTQLDYWVAKADGKRLSADGLRWDWNQGDGKTLAFYDILVSGWQPSENWAHGGPIIERERIAVGPGRLPAHAREAGESWQAYADHPLGAGSGPASDGPTPLIAAMRAFVASKFGEEVP